MTSIKVLQKYTLGQELAVLNDAYESYRDLLVEDYPTILDLRFVDDLKKSRFLGRLGTRLNAIATH